MANIKNKLYPIITLVAVVLLWQVIVDVKNVPAYIVPSPTGIVKTLISDFKVIMDNTKVTIYESIVGFVISIALSFVLAVLMDSFKIVRKSLYPILVISQTIPTIAIAPLFIIWFGFGPMPKIIVVIITCFFPIVISLIDGFEKVDRDYINLFRTMKASRLQTFYHLKLPYAMVNLFSGLKIAATYMVMASVIGEWLGGDSGIGVYMVRAKSAYALDKVFAAIIVIVLISIIIIYIIDFISKRLIHWK
ncbi:MULTISPECIES: ABC transporter permease [Clostridium]|uniref:ABC transporter permease n=1 Tax=Clostridium TaxID=1485 RepID=UPI00069D2482|nr:MULTISPECIES: ABC transporter permease [Clostridium]KOF57003.1 ABC transporter permease [Clostridium sp. DMHC 10]MCD2348937.1 ABC transporter permease [Clostridium guangxiense]